MDAGAIAGFAISINRTAVPNGLQGFNAFFHDFTAWFAINRCHQTNTAGIMFHVRGIRPGLNQAVFHGLTARQPSRT